ncbi:MAG: hypothetical protein Q9219_007134 [cf. Caloplaca sp. 3 TL-2023]
MESADMEDEKDFKQMWTDAQIRFQKRTKRSLAEPGGRSLDHMLKELDERLGAHDPQENDKQQRVKRLASNVLAFVQLLGGIAAQAASIVFGPADLCFNAMQFLISIPAKVSSFYEGLALLFEEVSISMKQFKIYQRIEESAKVDVELKHCIHKLLIIFVDICAISIEILSGSRLHSWKITAKAALFDDDSGVGAKLEELRRLVNHQSQISDAVTLEHVLKSENKLNDVHDVLTNVEAGTEVLVQYANASKGQQKQQEQFNHICNKLSVTPESVQKLERESDEIRSRILPHTGLWLERIDLFNRWTQFESDIESHLLLVGKSGAGKSSLAFSILHNLKLRYSTLGRNSMRIYPAFHRFAKMDKPLRDDPIKYALKSVGAQVAHQDIVYSKRLHTYLESKDASISKDMSLRSLYERLIPSPSTKDGPDIAYVLLFDGLDQLSEDEASQLLDALFAIKSRKVRILLTGTEESFSGKSLDSLPMIRVTDHNDADIKQFIDSELKACNILQGDVPEILRIVESTRQKLPGVVDGNFSDVHQIIEKVSVAVESDQPEDQIIELLSVDTLKNKDKATQRLVTDVSNSLTTPEIIQLNELLAWTIYAFEWMTMDEMRSALYLCTKRTPLQSLEVKIKQKFSKLLKIEPENGRHDYTALEMRDDDLEFYFRDTPRTVSKMDSEGNSDPRISMTITIDHVNVSKVQRFLWDLSENIVFERFPFKESVTDLEQTVTVSANFVEANLLIAKRCFEILQDEPIKETQKLGKYAVEFILDHLHVLKKETIDCPPRLAEREDILIQLISLLQSADSIEEYLTEEFLGKGYWLDKDSELEAIEMWLGDLEAADTVRLSQKDRRWLKRVKSRGIIFALTDVAAMVARQWMCKRTWRAPLPFRWIDAFLDRLDDSHKQDGAQTKLQSDQDRKDLSAGSDANEESNAATREENSILLGIQRAAEWVQKESGVAKDSLWYERLGDTYLCYDQWEYARSAYLEGQKLPNSSWKLSMGLAKVYAGMDKKITAVQEIDAVLTHLQGKENLTTNEKAELTDALVLSADWQSELENADDAARRLREVVRLDENLQQGSSYQLLKLFVDKMKWSEALDLFDELATHQAKDSSLTRLEAMLLELSDASPWHEWIKPVFSVVRYGNLSQAILQALRNALSFAMNEHSASVMCLLLCRGVAFSRFGTEDDNLQSALEDWKDCCRRGFDSEQSYQWNLTLLAAENIFNSHFSRAKSIGHARIDFDASVAELKALMESMKVPHDQKKLCHMLGSFCTLFGARDAAQTWLLSEMKSALDLLSDDDPENDYQGYAMIGEVLLHTGDDLNALSAWSLYGPGQRYNINAPQGCYSCDGCYRYFDWTERIWFCKICYRVQHCGECTKKIRNGTLEDFNCRQDHEWLCLSSWSDEYNATGKDRVRVGGEIRNGERMGGEIKLVTEWLEEVRMMWGIEKPTLGSKDDGGEQEKGQDGRMKQVDEDQDDEKLEEE